MKTQILKSIKVLSLACLAFFSANTAFSQNDYNVYTESGKTVISGNVIDQVKVENSAVNFYEGVSVTHSFPLSDVLRITFLEPFTVTNFSPMEGVWNDVVTLSGANFGDNIENIHVFFNNTEAEIFEVNEGTLKVIVPAIADGPECIIKVRIGNFRQTYTSKFTYHKKWRVENVIVDVLPSGIAVDAEGQNLLFLRRFDDARIPATLGLYRLNMANTPISYEGNVSLLANYDLVEGGFGFTSVTYDATTKKFFAIAESLGSAAHIVEVDPANNWAVTEHAVESGINGLWWPGLTANEGKLYFRHGWTHTVVEIDAVAWTSRVVGVMERQSAHDEFSPAMSVAKGTNKLYIQIRGTSYLGYIDIATGESTWLTESSETGYVDGSFANARFTNGQQICSDNEGNIYLVDQDGSQAIRKITSTGVSTFLGGNNSNPDATPTQFVAPSGLATDAHGDFYIANTWAACIQKATFK